MELGPDGPTDGRYPGIILGRAWAFLVGAVMTTARMIATGIGIVLIIAGLIAFLMHLWVYGLVLAVIGATVVTIYLRKARQAQPTSTSAGRVAHGDGGRPGNR